MVDARTNPLTRLRCSPEAFRTAREVKPSAGCNVLPGISRGLFRGSWLYVQGELAVCDSIMQQPTPLFWLVELETRFPIWKPGFQKKQRDPDW